MGWLDEFDCLDVIGNGSFGIIRKVRRKSDGVIFARKDLNFERMSERDRKQIVAEVNILKDLHHPHIVRYHDRYVDRDAGILYILMEYCGGGDLSTVIKQATKLNRPLPEDTIWNYFMQILLALVHCHHPNGHSRRESGGNHEEASSGAGGSTRRPQILHRDLKPDNVFLSDTGEVKLGDFGLSKALSGAGPASFACTYVGTPYYMSPELILEKAYDSKSDMWSLGCLIYELCALKPPFFEAKTHAELAVCIKGGRIPPLPRGYSEGLGRVIKAMLNLNPAMRPSAVQLLQHERLELAHKVSETSKMIAEVKLHKQGVATREREVAAREAAMAGALAEMQAHVAELERQRAEVEVHVEARIREAVARREEELRMLVLQHEEGVKEAMARREAELMDAVRRREEEVNAAWVRREAELRQEVEKEWKQAQETWTRQWEELEAEMEERERECDEREREVEETLASLSSKGRKEKVMFEEVKNVLGRPGSSAQTKARAHPVKDTPARRPLHKLPMVTPTAHKPFVDFPASAMKGVILTGTGEPVATPSPAEFANLFVASPKPALNFAKIFDFEDNETDAETDAEEDEPHCARESPSKRAFQRTQSRGGPTSPTKASAARERVKKSSSGSTSSGDGARTSTSTGASAKPKAKAPSKAASSGSSGQAPPTLLRRPSTVRRASAVPLPGSDNEETPKRAQATGAVARANSAPAVYDLDDEDNLPSPFLKKVERERMALTATSGAKGAPSASATKKRSDGNLLRAVAAANAAKDKDGRERPSVSRATRAGVEARKVLLKT